MDTFFLPLLISLLILAAFLRDDFIFSLVYMFAGAYALSRWWSHRALSEIRVERHLAKKAFIGEEIPVALEVTNNGILPIVWARIHDSLPVELSTPNFFRRVVSFGPYERVRFEYSLLARKRGYYPIGPLLVNSGDILGLGDQSKRESHCDYLTIFPKIIPLSKIIIPSHSPMGSMRHKQPIFEDPNRVMGKRDYVAGDSLRQVDWKTTATIGRLVVKQFEPSISMDVVIYLNLNNLEYESKTRYTITELAIVVSASLANWVIQHRQSLGLVTNGFDPLSEGKSQSIPSHKGRGQLLRILDLLARVQPGDVEPFVDLLQRTSPHLSWGTTLLIISAQADEVLLDILFQAYRRGQTVLLVLCGPVRGFEEIQHKAKYYRFPIYNIQNERDMDIWRL